jgi:hypothetical protein
MSSIVVAENHAEEKYRHQQEPAKQAPAAQMSHLSMISRMTDQAAGEKGLSDSSNPVSLKKTKSKEQNKENFNRSNEVFSVFKKSTDSKG